MNKLAKVITGKSEGVTLIEALIALAILGVVAVAFLNGLFVTLHSVLIAHEHSVAQSLATSQLEYVKDQPYGNCTGIPYVVYDTIELDSPEYSDYDIKGMDVNGTTVDNIIGIPFNPDTGEVCYPDDMGIQSVTIRIYHSDDTPLLTLTDYKVWRW